MADNTILKSAEELSQKNEACITEMSDHFRAFEESEEKWFEELLKTINDSFARGKERDKDNIP